MVLLSAADVLDRHDDDALARLDERPGLRQAFETERHEARPDRRTLYFDAATGWRFVDLCDLCGSDLGYLEDAPSTAALCEECHDEEEAAWRTSRGPRTADTSDAPDELDAVLDEDDGYGDLDLVPPREGRRRAG
jgi:hypothetical protein